VGKEGKEDVVAAGFVVEADWEDGVIDEVFVLEELEGMVEGLLSRE
jgi:hypothetical protein